MNNRILLPWTLALAATVLVGFYWAVWATDRYVSRATVVLESPQIAPPEISFSSLMGGGAGGNTSDLLMLREYLRSTDMLREVTEAMPFRAQYSENGDWFSRLRDRDAPMESLHDYYLRQVSVEMDDYAGVLNISVQAYDPGFARDLANLLLEAGEAHMNEMGQRLAEEQVRFLEEQVESVHRRLQARRDALLEFQNREGLVSPTKTVESLSQVIATLEGELAQLRAREKALSSYQSGRSSERVRVRSEIEALREQIDIERDRLARAAGDSLNQVSAEYQTLELQAQFAQETYSSALAALENTRIEAARKLKEVSVLQSPMRPEYPVVPESGRNTLIFAIVALIAALIAHMLILIIRDHRD